MWKPAAEPSSGRFPHHGWNPSIHPVPLCHPCIVQYNTELHQCLECELGEIAQQAELSHAGFGVGFLVHVQITPFPIKILVPPRGV